jgi:hypothetical protein
MPAASNRILDFGFLIWILAETSFLRDRHGEHCARILTRDKRFSLQPFLALTKNSLSFERAERYDPITAFAPHEVNCTGQ